MTQAEADFYRWFEVFSLSPTDDGSEHLAFALKRKYVARARTGELTITEAGAEWFGVRAAQIITRCRAGFHEYRTKTPFCSGFHCQWCGECADRPCAECEAFYAAGMTGEKFVIRGSYDQVRIHLPQGDEL